MQTRSRKIIYTAGFLAIAILSVALYALGPSVFQRGQNDIPVSEELTPTIPEGYSVFESADLTVTVDNSWAVSEESGQQSLYSFKNENGVEEYIIEVVDQSLIQHTEFVLDDDNVKIDDFDVIRFRSLTNGKYVYELDGQKLGSVKIFRFYIQPDEDVQIVTNIFWSTIKIKL